MNTNGNWSITSAPTSPADAISGIINPLGGSSELTYCNSTQFESTLLPFDIPLICSITTKPSGASDSVRQFSYAKGYFDVSRREFRGFGEVGLMDSGLPLSGWQGSIAYQVGREILDNRGIVQMIISVVGDSMSGTTI